MNFIAKRLCTIDTEESKQYKKLNYVQRDNNSIISRRELVQVIVCYMLQIFLLEVIENYAFYFYQMRTCRSVPGTFKF